MERRCIALEDLAIGDVEGAIDGSGGPCIVVCPGGRWAVIDVEQLGPEDLEAIENARQSGYLVATGRNPWTTWHPWWLLCEIAGRCTVRAWQRPGNRRGVVELQLPRGYEMPLSPGPLWQLAGECARTLLGTRDWLQAEGVARARLGELASAMMEMADGVIGCSAG